MWTVNSDDVQRAKELLAQRRAETEARYAGEKQALDAECAVLDTLERVAGEFAARNGGDPVSPAASPANADPPIGGEADNPQQDGAAAPPMPDDPGPVARDEGGGLDILKPGSRWRFNRPTRPAGSEGGAENPSATAW